jgi:hydrogenase/urease accessory protein HupE
LIRLNLFWLLLVVLLRPVSLLADDLRPALLELREAAPGTYQVLWKTPARNGASLKIVPQLPDQCRPVSAPKRVVEKAVTRTSWKVQCSGGLNGGTFAIDGLDGLLTEVMVRIQSLSGEHQVMRLTALSPEAVANGSDGFLSTARTYLHFGFTHILEGYDHLLFLIALMLLISSVWQVIGAVSAFTLSHSITLAVSVLGVFRPPQPVIESLIALSILILAVELVRKERGIHSLTTRKPWLIAFAFGLLHGFGFASALMATGLPQQDIPTALLFFNLGVELGQIAFIAGTLILGKIVFSLLSRPYWLTHASHYLLGSIAAFWTIERVAAFWL